MPDEPKCWLEAAVHDFKVPCDGCGREIPVGEKHLNDISSCCGGCTRALCYKCVYEAYRLMDYGLYSPDTDGGA